MSESSNIFSIEIYQELSSTLKQQYEQLKKECFDWDKRLTPEQRLEHDDKFCSSKDKFLYIFALCNGLVIGQLVLLKREIPYDKSDNLLLGGIGGVCVTEKMQRRGIATTLLQRALQELQIANCDIAYLCYDPSSPGLIRLYSQVGFVRFTKPCTFLGKSGKRYTENYGMIAPIKSFEKFNQILSDKDSFDIGIGNW